MTGKYPARLLHNPWLPSGHWNSAKNRLREGRYLSNLPLEEVTIAETTDLPKPSQKKLQSCWRSSRHGAMMLAPI